MAACGQPPGREPGGRPRAERPQVGRKTQRQNDQQHRRRVYPHVEQQFAREQRGGVRLEIGRVVQSGRLAVAGQHGHGPEHDEVPAEGIAIRTEQAVGGAEQPRDVPDVQDQQRALRCPEHACEERRPHGQRMRRRLRSRVGRVGWHERQESAPRAASSMPATRRSPSAAATSAPSSPPPTKLAVRSSPCCAAKTVPRPGGRLRGLRGAPQRAAMARQARHHGRRLGAGLTTPRDDHPQPGYKPGPPARGSSAARGADHAGHDPSHAVAASLCPTSSMEGRCFTAKRLPKTTTVPCGTPTHFGSRRPALPRDTRVTFDGGQRPFMGSAAVAQMRAGGREDAGMASTRCSCNPGRSAAGSTRRRSGTCTRRSAS